MQEFKLGMRFGYHTDWDWGVHLGFKSWNFGLGIGDGFWRLDFWVQD